jgi:aminoglycoside phosphotransferase
MHASLQAAILSMQPDAAEIVDIQSYRPDFLPYPARVTLRTPIGLPMVGVLKVSASPDRLAYETQVLRALADLQLSVPRVLGGPVTVQNSPEPLSALLLSELPGHPLPWIGLKDLATAQRTCQLLGEAVDTLHALTPRVLAHPIAATVPSITLESELQMIINRGGPWFSVPTFAEALTMVQATLGRFTRPLVFSNGDYNPLNFLVADDAMSGWLDFEYACFEDPYIGFAKFVLWADDDYGWGGGAKSGLVERALFERGVAPAELSVRLVLRGLRHIQDAGPADPPSFMLEVISDAVRLLRQGHR